VFDIILGGEEPVQVFGEFLYPAQTWPHPRRIGGKTADQANLLLGE